MRSFWSFLICLSPAAVAMLIVLAAGKTLNEATLWTAMVLVGAGAVLSGSCVALLIHRAMAPRNEASGLKVFLGILAFLGTCATYATVGLAGGCVLAVSQS
jgi:hypothetical protein